MKKFLFFSLFLAVGISCKKPTSADDPAPTATTCLIQKVEYDEGYYEKYTFDANKKLISCVLTYKDETDKVVEVLQKYEYNASGNLLKTTNSEGYLDSYIYDANGLLTRVDFFNPKNVMEEQFAVTMDAQKRLTKVIAKTSGLTGVYEYNGQDNALSKVEVSYQGKVFDLYEVSSYETDKTKKSYDLTITGHPFDPWVFTGDMIYFPLNITPNQGLAVKGKVSTSYDENWENITNKLRVYYDYTATRKYNSNNFVIERTSNDAVSKTPNLKKYIYSNCN